MHNLPNFVHLHFDKTADQLGDIEKRVLKKAHERKVISTDVNAAISAESSRGERLADGIARVGGSWSKYTGVTWRYTRKRPDCVCSWKCVE